MHTPLPGAWSLITSSWNAFQTHWSLTAKYAAWFIVAAVVQQIGFLLPAGGAQTALLLIGGVAGIALSLWATVRLLQVIFALEDGQAVTEKTTANAVSFIWPLILVGILEALAVLGGFILLIIPGIYISVRLGFAKLFVFEGKRGRAALIASWQLTKDRFWPVFGRGLAGGLMFGLLILVVYGIVFLLLKLIGVPVESESGPVAFGVGVISGIIQAAFIALVTVFQVKFYNALKKTA